MRTLTATLTAAAKSSSQVPCVAVKASNRSNGAVRLKFSRLYSGSEAEGGHTAVLSLGWAPSSGFQFSLVRLRVGAAPDYGLYYQRVSAPGPGSDFATWNDTGISGVQGVASCNYNEKISQFYMGRFAGSPGALYHRESGDCGVTWTAWECLAIGCGTTINGMAASFQGSVNPACFWFKGEALYLTRRSSGTWETPWAKPGDLAGASGLALVYYGDWNIAATAGGVAPGVFITVLGDNYGYLKDTWLPWRAIISTVTETQYGYAGPSLALDW
jgi:hypothetical protein